jgi:putative ABC transport system substrate-binding protein
MVHDEERAMGNAAAGTGMRRRAFIGVFIGATAAWPVIVRAQQRRRVAILLTVRETDAATQGFLVAFRRRLQELGWTADRNIAYETRWASGDQARMQTSIAEIIRLSPDVILAQNTPMVAQLRKQVTTAPIVFVQVSDPVGEGFVESLARPTGNVTGFTNAMSSLGGKWVELLKEAAPAVSRVGYLFNRAAAPGRGEYYMEPLLKAAAALGLQAVPLELRDASEIERVIADFAAAGGNGMVGNSDSFITVNRQLITAVANRLRLPMIYTSPQSMDAGGLMAYGADTEQQWLGAAGYVDRILRGENPRDLPVQLPAKFVLTLNLKTAKAIGLEIPLFLQQRADEVIE